MSLKKEQKFIISLEKALTLLKSPIITEKTTFLSQYGSYGFITTLEATKVEIKSAIEQIFKVEVMSVNTLVQKGKRKVFKGRKGQRSNFKKAIVRLNKGHTIDIGAGL